MAYYAQTLIKYTAFPPLVGNYYIYAPLNNTLIMNNKATPTLEKFEKL